MVAVMQTFSLRHDFSICKMGTTQPDGHDSCIPTKASHSRNFYFRNNFFFLDEGGGGEKGGKKREEKSLVSNSHLVIFS